MQTAAGGMALSRDVISADGPDSTVFLQGQLSQDVAALSVGNSARTLLLQPQGKMVAALRLTRLSDTGWLLDVATGFGEQVLARLQRFKLRTDCALDLRSVPMIRIIGPTAQTIEQPAAELSVDFDWSGMAGRDLIGSAVSLPDGVVPCSLMDLEAVRVEAGVAAMGTEIDESTIPAEANVVDGAVSFTKGCFTGQELVARVDSRGNNTPRRLHGLLFDGPTTAVPSPGAVTGSDAAEVGRITSSAYSPRRDAPVALAYLKRSVEVGDRVESAGSQATVVALPMSGPPA
jgi:folate-binding protein YgfZ